jgi:hypothetical protein
MLRYNSMETPRHQSSVEVSSYADFYAAMNPSTKIVFLLSLVARLPDYKDLFTLFDQLTADQQSSTIANMFETLKEMKAAQVLTLDDTLLTESQAKTEVKKLLASYVNPYSLPMVRFHTQEH